MSIYNILHEENREKKKEEKHTEMRGKKHMKTTPRMKTLKNPEIMRASERFLVTPKDCSPQIDPRPLESDPRQGLNHEGKKEKIESVPEVERRGCGGEGAIRVIGTLEKNMKMTKKQYSTTSYKE